jgi:hypothetical protein
MKEAFAGTTGTEAKIDRSRTMFDVLPDSQPGPRLVWGRDIIEDVKSNLLLSNQYHRREAESATGLIRCLGKYTAYSTITEFKGFSDFT